MFSSIKTLPLIAVAAIAVISAGSWAQSGATPIFKRKAGSWQINITIEKVEGGGVNGDTKAIMQSMFDKQSEKPLCLTEAGAMKEDFVGNMVNSAKQRDCKNVTENITDKSINIVAKCAGEDDQGFTIAMEGDYSPTVTNMMMKTENAPSKNGPITMHMRTSSKWIGKCTPGQQEIYSPE